MNRLCFASFAMLSLAVPLAAQDEFLYDVPYVPTPQEVVQKMLEIAMVKPADTVYDLGCGDGRIVITAAKEFGAHAVGIDIDPNRIREANENAKKAGVVEKVRFIEKNLFEADFKPASVVTLYLLTSVNMKLRPKLLSELKPGARIVSHAFDMGDWQPQQTAQVGSSTVYYWVVPERTAEAKR